MNIKENSFALDETKQYWSRFYDHPAGINFTIETPSPFAQWCAEVQFSDQTRLLELGCGNGRDTFGFLRLGLPVIAVDQCETVITKNQKKYLNNLNLYKALGEFHALNIDDLKSLETKTSFEFKHINTIYTRFVMHAVPETIEDKVLVYCTNLMPKGSQMWHEFRTIRDPLLKVGKQLSTNERLTDHYRRFIDPDNFRNKVIRLGWKELFFLESDGLAQIGDQDPVVLRIGFEKI